MSIPPVAPPGVLPYLGDPWELYQQMRAMTEQVGAQLAAVQTTPGPAGPAGATGGVGATGADGPAGAVGPAWMTGLKLLSTLTNATTSMTNISDLAFTATAGQDYRFEFFLPFTVPLITTGIGLTVAGPAASLFTYKVAIPTGTGTDSILNASVAGVSLVIGGLDVAGTPRLAQISGLVRNVTSTGTIVPQFRSTLAPSGVQVLQGAYGSYKQIS